jgi:hypothetical protein
MIISNLSIFSNVFYPFVDKSSQNSARNSEERAERGVSKEVEKHLDNVIRAIDVGNFYDKNISFFDNISCESLEKEEGYELSSLKQF